MLKIGKLVWIALLPLWIAGCQSASETRSITASLPTVTVPEEILLAPPAPLVVIPPPTIPPPATATPSGLISARLAWPTNWVNAWVPLESWGKFNGLGKPVQTAVGPNPVYQIGTTNGTLAFRIGSRVAWCNGLECWLGYAPRLIKGVPYLHSLDAQKSFQPFVGACSYQFRTNRVIVLDPGHGGKDSGTKSVAGKMHEKDYTLDWALRLERLLATNGWKVVLTRSTDLDLPLADRVAAAERAGADLFLSLHFNSGQPNRELAGLETYCLTPTGMPSNLTRNYEDDPKQTFPNNAFDEQNFQVAWRVHRELVQGACAADRGVRRARFMAVLRGQNRPAVLIEGGYLSNPKEAKLIATAAHRQSLAEAVARALE